MTSLDELTEPKVEQFGPPDNGEFLYVDISSVDNQAKRIVEPKRLNVDTAPSRARQRLRTGDVLVSMTRPNLNAVALVPPELDGAVGSTGFHVLRAVDGVEPKWLYYLVQTRTFIEAMSRVVQGALYPAIRPSDIRGFRVAPPALSDQRRIVAEIEKQFSRLDEAVAGLRRVDKQLLGYRRATVLIAVTGSKDSLQKNWDSDTQPELPEGWRWAHLSELASVSGGLAKSSGRRTAEPTRRVAYLRVANVQRGYLDLEEIKYIDATETEIEALRLKFGDVSFNEGGDRDKLGRGWIWKDELPEVIHQNHVFRARPDATKANSKFLSYCGNSYGAAWFWRHGKQSVNLASISLRTLRAFPVALPPIDEQHRIVAELERRLSVCEQVEASVRRELERSQRVRETTLSAGAGEVAAALDARVFRPNRAGATGSRLSRLVCEAGGGKYP